MKLHYLEYSEIYFIDSLWSGIYYKIDKNIELYLGNTNIKKNV